MNNYMIEFKVLKDIPYGEHERQKLDIFIPDSVVCDSGVIFFIHGGGWTQGDKAGHHHDADYFSRLGYICASMNYRYVSENVNVFDELDDVESALGTLKNVCKEYAFNIDKAILSGGSAGSHLALLYAYTRKNDAPITPVAACVYCPPVACAEPDFLMGISGEFEDWKNGVLSKCCGITITKDTLQNPEQQKALRRISPDEYVSKECVPTAVFQGRLDYIVPFAQVNKFINKLTESGVTNSLLIYENSDHALDKDPDCSEKSREIIREYAEKYFEF